MHVEKLTSDALELEFLPEAGGRMHRLRAFEQDVLRTPPRPEAHLTDPFYWGAFPLVPWSNRVSEGRIDFDRRAARVPCNDGRFAIHGETFLRPWELVAPGALVCTGGAGAFPWPYTAELRYTLDGAALTITLAITNSGASDLPAGLGIHPWFDASDGLLVALPAELAYPLANHVPAGEPRPVRDRLNRRALSPVPWGTDDLWTGLTEQAIELAWPTRGLRARFAFTDAATHVVMAAFAQQQAIAIEPVTHAIDGFRLLAGGRRGAVAVLTPGATLAVAYTLAFARG